MIRPTFALALTILCTTTRAFACGGFFSDTREHPSLAHEQVLIAYDAAGRKEHFVRRVVFRRIDGVFGFVVPTPSRPEVGSVPGNPFVALDESFPFRSPPPPEWPPGPIRPGRAGGGLGGVSVLEQLQVGSFTAFVLAANDPVALSQWLKNNKLISTPENDEWLAHYVRLGFYYVALRYDPPPSAANEDWQSTTSAETIRISFSTPHPFYPYLEPRRDVRAPESRLLELWTAFAQSWTPVAWRSTRGRASFVRPLRQGKRYVVSAARPSRAPKGAEWVDASGSESARLIQGLLPNEPGLIVQTFQDQKFSREGFGDIVFAPEAHEGEFPWHDDLVNILVGESKDEKIRATALSLLTGERAAGGLAQGDVDAGKQFDGALAHRIDSVRTPEWKLDAALGAPQFEGSVDRAAVAVLVDTMRAGFRRCYRDAHHHPVAAHVDYTLTLELHVSTTGIDANTVPAGAVGEDFDACVRKRTLAADLPRFAIPQFVVRVPVVYRWIPPPRGASSVGY